MPSNITNILSRFGFSEIAVSIYTAVLSLDKPTATEISRKMNLQRTLVYFHIKELIQKDIIREVGKDKIKRFRATPPKELAERFQRWTTDVYSIVPDLEAMANIDEQTPVVTVHDFESFHYEHYNELASMPVKSEFRVIQSQKSAKPDFQAFKPGEWEKLMKRMIERKIMTRAIFTQDMIQTAKKYMDEETYALFKKRNWQLRSVEPEKFDFEEMMIHQDKVTYLLTDVGIMVRIQHKRIAQAMIAMFDALWITGRPQQFD